MYDVITIGTATRDAFVKSPAFKVIKSPEFITGEAECFSLGSKIKVPEIIFTTGGGATNVAVTFARQGLKTACAVRIGDDLSGRAVIEDLKKEKIAAGFIQKDAKKPTAYSILLLAPSGERTVLVYRGASEDFDAKKLFKNFLKTKWVYLAPLGGAAAENFKIIADFCFKNKIKVAANLSAAQIKIGIKKLTPVLNKIDILVLNQEEASYLTGIPYKNENKIFEALDKAVKGIVVMTKGPKGVSISDGKIKMKAGIFKEKKSADRTGAGDAFGSGFLSGLIQKTAKKGFKYGAEDLKYALRLGAANATSVIERIGAKEGILTKKEFLSAKRFKKLLIFKF
ncbi:MAG: carbohydrate kinase family protein [Patescibacteria group bacterium]